LNFSGKRVCTLAQRSCRDAEPSFVIVLE
jgi:hypothetical protein